MNRNGMSGERIITKNDDIDREVHEFRIDEWFRDRYSNISHEEYDILVKFDGDYRHAHGSTERLLTILLVKYYQLKTLKKILKLFMEGNF